MNRKTSIKYKHGEFCWDCYRATAGDKVAKAEGHGRISKLQEELINDWAEIRERAFATTILQCTKSSQLITTLPAS
jgi:hypothetical protein